MKPNERIAWIVAFVAIGTLLGLGIGGGIGLFLGGIALTIAGFASPWGAAPFIGLATGIGCSFVGAVIGLVFGFRIGQSS